MAEKRATSVVEEAKLVQLIVFHVGDEELCVPIEAVQEIVRTGPITPIPDSPEFVQGLINVRGEIVATINLRARFFFPTENVEPKHIVITRQEDSLFGILVDEVTEVLRIPQTDIKAPHKLMTTIHEDYVSGVVPIEKRLIIVLDLARVLSTEELGRLSEITRKHREREDVEPLASEAKTQEDIPSDVVGALAQKASVKQSKSKKPLMREGRSNK